MHDWSTPFDPSLLGRELFIHVPTEELAEELAQLLEAAGITWAGGRMLTEGEGTCWREYRENTVWHIYRDSGSHRRIRRGDLSCCRGDAFGNVPICTFNGITPLADFDIPDDASLF